MIHEVADRYGLGLFELAKEKQTIQQTKQQCELLKTCILQNPDVMHMMLSVKIKKEEKKAFLKTVLSQFDEDILHLCYVLLDAKRMEYLVEVLDSLIGHAQNALGIQKAMVYSAQSLSKEELITIQNKLEQDLQCKIEMETHIDESLIAGFKVVVGSNIYDLSIKHKINTLTQHLKGGRS